MLPMLSMCVALAGQPDAAPPAQPNATQPASGDVEALQREIASLRQSLAEAENRYRRLEQDYAAVREQLAAAERFIAGIQAQSQTPMTLPPSESRAPVPEDPMASPASLLAALQSRYALEFGNEAPTEAAALADYRDRVEKWVKDISRELRGRPTWLVTISDVRETESGRMEGWVRIIDESSGLPIGDPFITELSRSQAARIREGGFDRWRTTVALNARPRFNPERRDEGVFNVPAFIGPFVEFGFGADFRSLLGVEAQAPEPSDTPKAPEDPGNDPGGIGEDEKRGR